MIDPNQDGVSHINVYSKGRTEIGRMLSHFYVARFSCADGQFRTIEGYWYWLSCHDERLRCTDGWASKQLGRSLRSPDWPSDPGFKDKIRAANRAKIVQHPNIYGRLVQTFLPFAHYYVYKGVVREADDGQWILDHLEALRAEFKGRNNT